MRWLAQERASLPVQNISSLPNPEHVARVTAMMASSDKPAQSPTPGAPPLVVRHERTFEGNRFVYPVLSRRSGGLSVGVNLNPDKVCNFDCIYCQVDRTSQSETRFVATRQLLAELESTLRT